MKLWNVENGCNDKGMMILLFMATKYMPGE